MAFLEGKMNRKGTLFTAWVEGIALFLLIVGFVISFTSIGSTFVNYIVILLWGFMFGRLWHRFSSSSTLIMVIILASFLIGYTAASMIHRYGNPVILALLYLTGIITSYNLHAKGFLKVFDI